MDIDSAGRPAEYLGDGAYVRWSGWAFVIYTTDGINELSSIELDVHAMQVLDRFRADIKKLQAAIGGENQ